MKCIKSITGEIKRVSNDQASRLVSTGSYSYCPKAEWKLVRPSTTVVKPVEDDTATTDAPKTKKVPGRKNKQTKR